MSTQAETASASLVERFTLKAFVESCLVLEEGVASMKDIDLGMMAGAGIIPPPFARADQLGLDDVLARLERAADEWGEAFEPPRILRRLVAQGRLGVKSGQGFFPYARPDPGWDEDPVKLETRGDVAIAWLDRPPANSISPEVVAALQRVWDAVTGDGGVRALVLASANPMLFCAGADIKAFTTMDAAAGGELLDQMHELLRSMERSSIATIAAVGALALGGGCELAMACTIRLAADGARLGQPEIALGLIPGYAGTQRLPRLVGKGKAMEMILTGAPIAADEAQRIGLVNRVVPAAELMAEARKLAGQLAKSAPIAMGYISNAVNKGVEMPFAEACQYEATLFGLVASTHDMKEGTAAFLEKRAAVFKGR
jgi:enoyl-CoA hydratase / 3-hydroxyacyl-CoA dehydrogenase